MLDNARILVQGTTPHAHEQDAIQFVIATLPNTEPFRLWALCDLVDLAGRRYELDLLLLGYDALYHVECKAWRGRISGDTLDWQIDEGRPFVRENPLRLAEHKSRVLASLLDRHLGPKRPYVETLVFLTDPHVEVTLKEAAAAKVITRHTFERAIRFGEYPGAPTRKRDRIDGPTAKKLVKALADLGLRKSKAAPRVGTFALGELLGEGPGYQDFEATKERLPDFHRRVRCYLVPQSQTTERKEQLRRAADREARILTTVGDHRGILRMTDYEADGPTGGPCLVFDDFKEGVPLDAFLRRNPKLPFDYRQQIVEQVADALTYCHRKKILHRALAPSAVLVRFRQDQKGVETRLFNFQVASSADASQNTVHLSQLSDEPALVYRAPEVIEDPTRARQESDVFSLGALTYFLFTGRHPGATLAERQQLLDAGGGHLSVAATDDNLSGGAQPLDGIDEAGRKSLDEVLAAATHQNVVERMDDAIEWAQILLDALTAPDAAATPAPTETIDLLEARAEQTFDGYKIVKVLGSGATARVLRVARDHETFALKVSRSPEHDEHLKAEAVVLQKLRGDRIVGYHGTLQVGPRLCLLLEDAGETLADILAKEGPQSLDFARRWGDDLLHALRELEKRHVLHRDIKPANLGVPSSGAKRTRNLFLFDFSLAAVDPRVVTVGTPAYRDPFVVNRGHWDEAADRYSAAVTLYEIVTGTRPRWGDNEAAATATTEPILLEPERFDPSVRTTLAAFFQRALLRSAADRFDSADAMREAWLDCFPSAASPLPIEASPLDEPETPRDYASLADATPIAAIDGLSVRAKNALDRSGVICVRDLLSLPTNQLSAIRGVGRDTARDIFELIGAVKATRTESPSQPPFAPDFVGPDRPLAELRSIPAPALLALENAGLLRAQELAATPRVRVERILAAQSTPPAVQATLARLTAALAAPPPPVAAAQEPRTLADWIARAFPAENKADHYLRELFALEPAPGGDFVTEVRLLAERHAIKSQNLYTGLSKAREAWSKDQALAPIIGAVSSRLSAQGGLGSTVQLGQLLLGSLASDGAPLDPDCAERAATALVRMVGELRDDLVLGRMGKTLWIAESAELLTLGRQLGDTADRLAQTEPLPSFEQARDALRAQAEKTRLDGLPAERLLALAADASQHTALSARLELYPIAMTGERALRLSAGALSSSNLKPAQVRQTVALRYPKAAPLPTSDDELARLVLPLGLTLKDGVFIRPGAGSTSTSHTQILPPRKETTHSQRRPTTNPQEQAKREFAENLRTAARNRSFRVLEVTAAYADDAAKEIGRVLDTQPISLERAILQDLYSTMQEQGIDPEIVVETDRQGPSGSEDWQRLVDLVGDSATSVVDALVQKPGLLLLTQPGVLARYGLQQPLLTLLQATQRDQGPGIFLLVPRYSDASATPVIDAPSGPLPIPLSSPAQRLPIPDAWLTNE